MADFPQHTGGQCWGEEALEVLGSQQCCGQSQGTLGQQREESLNASYGHLTAEPQSWLSFHSGYITRAGWIPETKDKGGDIQSVLSPISALHVY